jgi:hypothetical protein
MGRYGGMGYQRNISSAEKSLLADDHRGVIPPKTMIIGDSSGLS